MVRGLEDAGLCRSSLNVFFDAVTVDVGPLQGAIILKAAVADQRINLRKIGKTKLGISAG